MRCNNCGAEIEPGVKFCPFCGSKVEAQEDSILFSDATPHSQTGGSGNEILTVLKFFGTASFILFAFFAIRNIFNTISLFFSIITYYSSYAIINSIISAGISGAVIAFIYAIIAIGFLLTGCFYKKGRTTSVFSIILAGVAFLALGCVIFRLSGRYLIYAIVLTVILFGLLYAAGDAPYISNTQGISDDIKNIPNAIKEGLQDLAAFISKFASKNQNQNQNQARSQFQNTQRNYSGYSEQMYTASGPSPMTGMTPLKTDRSLLVYILLSLITCGIYSWYFIYSIAKDLNVACAGDGKKTQGALVFFLLNLVTCGIYSWIWYYQIGNRLAANAPRYGMLFTENGTTILMWFIFGSLLCGIGPFIAVNILIQNTNSICMAYNKNCGFM